jgi:hypothetical protein
VTDPADDPGPRTMVGDALMRALIDAGIVSPYATHVIIDIEWRQPVRVHLVRVHEEALGDERLLDVLPAALAGADVVRERPRSGDAEP